MGHPNPQRADKAFQIRYEAAHRQRAKPWPVHQTNGDESLYPNRIGNFSKGLPHNHLGEVEGLAYLKLLDALHSGDARDFENIPLGATKPSNQRHLVNPQAAFAFVLTGPDSHGLSTPPPPAFHTPEQAAEMAECYWMAIARDVPFVRYESDPLVDTAAYDLTYLPHFQGPRDSGKVTPRTAFRGITHGDLIGPYVSQFLVRDVPYGSQRVSARIQTAFPGKNFAVDYTTWLHLQNGEEPEPIDYYDPKSQYIRTGRDLAEYVHRDEPYQAYLNASLILLTPPRRGGMGAPFDPGNSYTASRTQDGFVTFGSAHLQTLLAEVTDRALKAVWFQKWLVHRRLRPEEFGGRIYNHKKGDALYPIHADILHQSSVLSEINRKYSTYLLPLAYPEGCPLHPAYGAGHSTIAGACVTVLKAWFDESFRIPDPVTVSQDGNSIQSYDGSDAMDLTVGGELNKLAGNIALGRNFAGIHWRSDYTEGIKLGEEVALDIMREQAKTFHEEFSCSLTTFDGRPVTITNV